MKNKLRLVLLTAGLFLVFNSQSQTIPVWKLSDLEAALKESKEPTIINFWATFCKPCIAELPHFQALADKYKKDGVRLILVSLDLKEAFPNRIHSFAKKLKLTSPVVFLDETNADIFCPAVDSSWSGAIPATIFINPATGYRKFYEEEFSKKGLEEEIKKMMLIKKEQL